MKLEIILNDDTKKFLSDEIEKNLTSFNGAVKKELKSIEKNLIVAVLLLFFLIVFGVIGLVSINSKINE